MSIAIIDIQYEAVAFSLTFTAAPKIKNDEAI